jgi:4-amino-4-deoxy-L-arabinose transferase-like glycosyltransferase
MPITSRRIRSSRWLLAALILAGFALRIYRIDTQSLWYDEGFSIALARSSLAEAIAWTAQDVHPPLYYLLLHFWIRACGDAALATRLFSLLVSVAAIPVFYHLARRAMSGTTGLAAALLATISPFYVYYAQETRMYALVTLLTLLSSYLLLRLATEEAMPPKRRLHLWIGFAALSVAAIYTHYFSFFVLAFQGLYYLLSWLRRNGRARDLVPALLATGAMCIAYLPWLPTLLARYASDTGYFGGSMAPQESISRILASFSAGDTFPRSAAIQVAQVYLALMVVGVALRTYRIRKGRESKQSGGGWAFVVMYLLIPLASIALLYYFRPKASSRYAMVASPPFLILLGSGIAALWEHSSISRRRAVRWVWRGFSLAALVFFLGVSGLSLRGLYLDPNYRRPDFRGAVQYVRDRRQSDESTILLSGHFFPIFDYYDPDARRYPIPNDPVLQLEHTVGYRVASELNKAAVGYNGAWLLLWQDEVIDPNQFVLYMLQTVGREVPVDTSFHKITIRYFDLPPNVQFRDVPVMDELVDVRFRGGLRLLGYSLPARAARDGAMHVILYWQGLQRMTKEYQVSLRVMDRSGHEWGRLDRRPAAYAYPTSLWRPGEILFGESTIPLVRSAPPDEYLLQLRVYSLDEMKSVDVLTGTGESRGKTFTLGPIPVEEPATWPGVDTLDMSQALGVELTKNFVLLGSDLDLRPIHAGESLPVTLFWSATGPIAEHHTILLDLRDEAGDIIALKHFEPANIYYPTDRWSEGAVVHGKYRLSIPLAVSPGRATLGVSLGNEDGEALEAPVFLAEIQLTAPERTYQMPDVQRPSGANLGGVCTLVGADLDGEEVSPGEKLTLTLYWQSDKATERSFTVFTHLLDADEHVLTQHDSEPVKGLRPTYGWVPNEIVRDEHPLIIPSDERPGEYLIEVGMYELDEPGLPRLPVLADDGAPAGDRILLGTVTVRKKYSW